MPPRNQPAIISALVVLIVHLLKWRLQPHLRGRSWQLTLAEQRRRVQRMSGRSPSLGARLPALIDQAWPRARRLLADEMGVALRDIPLDNPFSANDLIDLTPEDE